MKKIFTLIAAAFMAVSVNAQGVYGVQSGDAGVAAGTTYSGVPNITMTWGVAGGEDFKGGNKESKTLETLLGATGFCEGNGESGKLKSGTVYYYEPAQAGTLTVGVVLNAGKAFYVQDIDGKNVDFVMTDSEGTTILTENGGKLEAKVTGAIVTFSVAAGKKYAVYCAGSKLGYYGFKYEVGGTGIEGVTADKVSSDVLYNVAGQRVNANAKGLVIKNGKKIIK